MKRIRNFGFFALLWLAMSAIVSAAPITVSLTNIGQDYNLLGGGEFHATINGTTNVEVFCIDWQNYLTQTSGYDAYLSDTTDLSKTRYGNTAASDFLVEPVTPQLTALERYTMAAWLITQYTLNPATLAQDQYDQQAVWNLLTQKNPSTTPPGYLDSNVVAAYTAALAHKDDVALQSQIHILTSTDAKGYNCGQQEFLYLTSSVPEPATILLLGSALVGLAMIRRKRA